MKKAVIGAVVILLVGIIAFRIVGSRHTERVNKERAQEKIPVAVTRVELGTVEETISSTGNFEARTKVDVCSKVAGRIERLAVDTGDRVEKGDVIAKIEDEEIVLHVEQAEAGLVAAKTSLENLRVNKERTDRLFAKGSVSQQQKDQIDARYKTAKAQVQQAEAALALAKEQLKNSRVTAPISGIIAKRYVDVGAMVAPSVPLVNIVQMNTVKVVVNIIEKDIGRIKLGDLAKIRVEAYPDQEFEGKVVNLSPVVDRASRTAAVEVKVPNRDYKLKPGMFAEVKLVLEIHEDVPLVPRAAIIEGIGQRKEGSRHVFLVDGDKAMKREVEVGLAKGDKVEVLSGIKKGERVVIAGQHYLKGGEEVEVVKETAGD